MRRRCVLWIAFTWAVGGCATAHVAPADTLAGCWYFDRTAAAERLNLPWGVELRTDSVQGWPAIQQLTNVRRAVTLIDATRVEDFPFGYWRALRSDSVEIGYPAGGGLLLSLAVQPPPPALATALAGTARALGDARPPGQFDRPPEDDPVSLTRAMCP
jgi:hypothetical protein